MIFSLVAFLAVVTVVRSSILNLDLALDEIEKTKEWKIKFCPTIYHKEEDVRAIGTPFREPSSLNAPSAQEPLKRKAEPLKIALSKKMHRSSDNETKESHISISSNDPIFEQASPNGSFNVVNESLEAYLDVEVMSYSFIKNATERRNAIRQMITLIANNDVIGFENGQKAFKQLFNCKFNSVRKNGIPFLNFYIIYFGATYFAPMIRPYAQVDFESMHLREAFMHLIENYSLPVIASMMSSCNFMSEDDQKFLCEAIYAKFPELSNFKRLMFEFPHINDNMDTGAYIQHSKSTTARLNIFRTILIQNQDISVDDEIFKHFGYKRFLQIFMQYPEVFSNLPMKSKFLLARIAVMHENLDALVKIFELDGSVVLGTFNGSNLLDMIVHHRKLELMPLILTVAPELAFSPKSGGNVSVYESFIIADDVEIIEAFEASGFSSEDKTILKGLNAIQMAYYKERRHLMQHFTIKYGRTKVAQYLREL